MKTIPFTKAGYDAIRKEREDLKLQRPPAVIDLTKARNMGDLSENGYYKSAKMKLVDIDRRIREVAYIIQHAIVIKKSQNNTVQIGSTVVLTTNDKEVKYEIVGGYESNPLKEKISQNSPLGKLLIGKKVGDTVILNAPKGKIEYKIKQIG